MPIRTIQTIRNATILSCTALLALAGAAPAADVKIRFPTEYTMDIAPGIANDQFKKAVEEGSSGSVTVEMFPAGSLYKGVDILRAVLRGDVEMSTLVSPYWASISPQLSVFDLPYAFPSMADFRKVAENEEFVTRAFADVSDKGGVVLGLLPYGYLIPGTRQKELRTPEDMKGLRMRSLGRVNLSTLEALDAVPVSLNLTELTPALQQGLVDGLNAPIDIYIDSKWYDYINHVTLANYTIIFYPWVVNKAWWEGLEGSQRELIETSVSTSIADHWDRLERINADSVAKLKGFGVAVHEQTPEEAAVWREKTDVVWKGMADGIGADLIEALQDALK